VDPRHEQRARNEALVRRVNEQIERVDQTAEDSGLAGEQATFEFLCECGRAGGEEIACEAHVEMTLDEYEHVRAQDDRFALVPGHEDAALEDVVQRTDRFVIVDKKPAAEPFVDNDVGGSPSS
jgi:hypothetical protein